MSREFSDQSGLSWQVVFMASGLTWQVAFHGKWSYMASGLSSGYKNHDKICILIDSAQIGVKYVNSIAYLIHNFCMCTFPIKSYYSVIVDVAYYHWNRFSYLRIANLFENLVFYYNYWNKMKTSVENIRWFYFQHKYSICFNS